jgi:hypothetical protein
MATPRLRDIPGAFTISDVAVALGIRRDVARHRVDRAVERGFLQKVRAVLLDEAERHIEYPVYVIPGVTLPGTEEIKGAMNGTAV